MIIDHKITRNSGATLEPCIYKRGHGVTEQGYKMQAYPKVFAPVVLVTLDGYLMPVLEEPTEDDIVPALRRLSSLWLSPSIEHTWTDRAHHHVQQVMPRATELFLSTALSSWYERTVNFTGREVNVLHGDPTTENYMRHGVWLDPSIRVMPLEAELDGGKLLQSYFQYGEGVRADVREVIRGFLHEQNLNIDLCIYYMVTHIVRLYQVQPQAREWAIDLLTHLDSDALLKELRCR